MPTQKSKYISLKSNSGNYLSFELLEDLKTVDDSGNIATAGMENLRLLANTSEHAVALILEEQEGGEFHLKDAGLGFFLNVDSVNGDRILATKNPMELHKFILLKQNGSENKFAIKTPSGKHFLSEAQGGLLTVNASEVGDSEVFTINELTDIGNIEGHDHHGCCGPKMIPLGEKLATSDRKIWDDKSHEGIIHRTIGLLAGFAPKRDDIEQFLEIWRNIPESAPKYDFKGGQVFQGLHDADYKDEYIDRWSSVFPASYRTHFYNPKNRENYLEKKWHPAIIAIRIGLSRRSPQPIPEHLLNHVTAMSEGQRYFNLAVHHGRRVVRYGVNRTVEDMEKLGYYLGLSMHFLTDLTQPMHADNYTAVDIWGTWFVNFHGYFEKLVDAFPEGRTWHESRSGKALAKSSIATEDITFWQDHNHTSFGVVLHLLALYSQPILPSLGSYSRRHGLDEKLVTEFLAKTIQKAPNWAARAFMAFMHCSNQTLGLSDMKWYSITEVSNNQHLCAKVGKEEFLACADPQSVTEDKRLFCPIFNPDGTCSFVLKSDPSKLWTKNISGEIIQLKTGSSGTKDTSFKLIPGLHGSRWIYYDNILSHFALTVGSGNWDKHITGDVPIHGLHGGAGGYDKTNQLFKFYAGRDMTAAEQAQVKQSHPTHGMYEWWGEAK